MPRLVENIQAVKLNFSFGRWDQSQDSPADGGLTAAAFTDEPKGFARGDLKAHAVNGLDMSDNFTEQSPADREIGLETVNFNKIIFGTYHRSRLNNHLKCILLHTSKPYICRAKLPAAAVP